MQQRHEELRQDRQAELQLVAEDFERRLEELRGSLRREADHARAAAAQGPLVVPAMGSPGVAPGGWVEGMVGGWKMLEVIYGDGFVKLNGW